MSYEIIYKKLFISLGNDIFIPMVLGGSSNCYDMQNRRSRSWSHFKGYPMTKTEILEYVQTKENEIPQAVKDHNEYWSNETPITEKQYRDSYGYYIGLAIGGSTCSNTTFGAYKGIFIDGMKKAIPIEKAAELGLGFRIYLRSWDKDTEGVVKTFYPETAQEFYLAKEELETIKLDYDKSTIYVTMNETSVDRYFDLIKRQNKLEKQTKEKVEVDYFFTIQYWDKRYYRKTTARGLELAYHPYKKFPTEKQANAFLGRVREYWRDSLSVVRVDEKTQI